MVHEGSPGSGSRSRSFAANGPSLGSASRGACEQCPGPRATYSRPPFTSLEEWRRLLLTTPDLAETRVFIQHYQDNLVSAEVFYKIVNEMIADSRTEMKQLGVMCAGVTPSVISFTILAGVEKTEATASAVRNQATGFLSHYATLTYVHILRSIMSGSAPSLAMPSLQQLSLW